MSKVKKDMSDQEMRKQINEIRKNQKKIVVRDMYGVTDELIPIRDMYGISK